MVKKRGREGGIKRRGEEREEGREGKRKEEIPFSLANRMLGLFKSL